MTLKTKIIDEIIRIEGGYVNDPDDSGKETNFGITKAVARAYGYTGHMEYLPRSVAFNIYTDKYWDSVYADSLIQISESVTEEVVDTAVNAGVTRAGTFLQRSLNALNNRAKLYPDLSVDGRIGPATIYALNECVARRDELTLLKALNCLQGAFYIRLVERREKDEKFMYGWLKNRVNL